MTAQTAVVWRWAVDAWEHWRFRTGPFQTGAWGWTFRGMGREWMETLR